MTCLQRHIGDHRSIANGLKLAVVSRLRPLQFDDYETVL